MNWFMFSENLKEFSSLYIVTYVVPISSLTILALVIMVSAFRGYRDENGDNTSKLTATKNLFRRFVPQS